MALRRARFLQSLLITVQGASAVSVVEEHRLLGLGVVVPLVERGQVDGAELPLLERVRLALLEAPALLVSGSPRTRT
jgi:hypothetical protein